MGVLFERSLFVYEDRNDGKLNQGTVCSLLFVNKVPFVLKKIFECYKVLAGSTPPLTRVTPQWSYGPLCILQTSVLLTEMLYSKHVFSSKT